MKAAAIALAAILWPAPAAVLTAQDSHAGHTPAAPPAILEIAARPVPLKTGIGTAHDPTGTASKEAQAFYDQGLACLHSYAWLEAARSFNRALALDSGLAIAHAQLSLAYVELNKAAAARAELKLAQTLAPGASDHDRTHVTLRSLQMSAEDAPRDAARRAAYRAALDAALRKVPGDEELWLARGHAESADPAERGQGAVAASISYFEKALALAPDHFAAHHYLTHAHENAGRPAEALAEATIYSRMAPNVAHARHMRGHDLQRTGRIEEALAEFTAADALGTEYFKADKIPPEYDWHYQHNLDLLAASHQYLGHLGKAESLFTASFAIPSSSVEQEFNKREWPAFLLARGRVTEALTASRVMAAHRSPIVSAEGHVLVGEALLALGRLREVAEEGNVALRLMRGSPEGAGLVANSFQALQGAFLLKTGQQEKGRGMLEGVVHKLRAAPGPDGWMQALFTLEALARVAREAGDWILASRLAERIVEHDPNYAGGHYARALVAEHQGDTARARAAFEAAARYWQTADPELPELQTARNHGYRAGTAKGKPR